MNRLNTLNALMRRAVDPGASESEAATSAMLACKLALEIDVVGMVRKLYGSVCECVEWVRDNRRGLARAGMRVPVEFMEFKRDEI